MTETPESNPEWDDWLRCRLVSELHDLPDMGS